MEIVLASGNPHKKEELNKILEGYTILLPSDLGVEFDVEETGTTYLANALLKAEDLYKKAGGRMVLADDSGLSVKALGGKPGIYSARYGHKEAGRELSAKEKNQLLLKNMEGITDRSAFFVCCMVLIAGDYRVYSFQETLEGEIAHEVAGGEGFGYDPVFYLPQHKCTVAEISSELKNRISHRGKAGAALAGLLNQMKNP